MNVGGSVFNLAPWNNNTIPAGGDLVVAQTSNGDFDGSDTNSPGQSSTSQELAQNNAGRNGRGGTNDSQVGRGSPRVGQSGETNLQASASGQQSGQNPDRSQNGSQNPGELASNSDQQQRDPP